MVLVTTVFMHTNLANCSLLGWDERPNSNTYTVSLQHGFSYNSLCAYKPTQLLITGVGGDLTVIQTVSLCLSFSYKMCHCASVSVTTNRLHQFMHKNLPNGPLLGSEERPNSNTACVIVPRFHLQQTVFMHTNLPNHSLLELVSY